MSAVEIQPPESGFGLGGVLGARASPLYGILNGVDYGNWDPQADPHVTAHYSEEDLSGKRLCKQDLVREFGLPAAAMKRPLLGVVSRLTPQKGIELIIEIAEALPADDLYLVVLGLGDAVYEDALRGAGLARAERICVRVG